MTTDTDTRTRVLRYIGPATSDDAMRRAGRKAYNEVDEDDAACTYISVIERFDRATFEANGTTYGELWIANEAATDDLTEAGAEWQEVDGYGY